MWEVRLSKNDALWNAHMDACSAKSGCMPTTYPIMCTRMLLNKDERHTALAGMLHLSVCSRGGISVEVMM